ncbi:MAG: sodium:proton antiporter NhaD [Granulosicoccaceae bacterium]
MKKVVLNIAWLLISLPVGVVVASESDVLQHDLTGHWTGLLGLVVFALAYLLVAGEEPLSLKKSKPMLVAAGLIWVLVAMGYIGLGDPHSAEAIFRTTVERFTELFLFLLAAMTYVNAMSERGLFAQLRQWLVTKNFSLRKIFWLTGGLAFVLSPFIANLAVALLMVTVLIGVAPTNRSFLVAGSISIVVATNAGGIYSPLGDITTLMVWQRGFLDVQDFILLFFPALVCWLIPAIALSISVGSAKAEPDIHPQPLYEGAGVVACLFVLTLVMAVLCESLLKLPAVVGMMTGLGLLKLYGYRLKRQGMKHLSRSKSTVSDATNRESGEEHSFDIFRSLERSEWDTLMFLLGIVVAISGLHAMGYLLLTSEVLYGTLGPTTANILLGVVSALVENVAVMYSVLDMHPEMSHSQWLLVTFTAGVGGSLLSIGSAAGVAVMGQARGIYTFMSHLRWTWVIALGYGAGAWLHLFLNSGSVQ